MYYTVVIYYVPTSMATEWHPTDPDWVSLTRGAFSTFKDAVNWARSHLNGLPYSVKVVDD